MNEEQIENTTPNTQPRDYQQVNDNKPQTWERNMIEKIALTGLSEQRKTRRWGIFFKSLFLIYLVVALYVMLAGKSTTNYDAMGNSFASGGKDNIALIRLVGVIAADKKASADNLTRQIKLAGDDASNKGILIYANSPGGSPVQSSLVYQAIKAYKTKNPKRKVLTVVADMCASGCYFIVSASDEIYANRSSIVGSIGVIAQNIGYGETMKKLGLEPRTFISGENKDFLNPTRPIRPDEKVFMQNLLDELHTHFIEAVKAGRGNRLDKAKGTNLFTGLFWSGEDAVKLGLIDGLATPEETAKKIGNYPVTDYAPTSSFDKIISKFGATLENVIIGSTEKMREPQSTNDIKFN